MASRFTKDFVKLRHKSRVFTPNNIAALGKCLDMSDLVSLVFLMCGNDQIGDMFKFLTSEDCTSVASLDLYKLFTGFPEWERKLPEALGAIKNNLALSKLDISQKDLQCNRRIKDSELSLFPTKIALYRVIEELTVRQGINLISKMVELGAPLPLTGLSHLELYLMFCHSQGFLNIERRENFEIIAKSLKSIGKPDLADFFTAPKVVLDNYVFDDHLLGAYHIKNPENPGLCIIINQVRYGGKKTDRESSIVNLNGLRHLMGILNFSVVSIEDLTKPELCKMIKTTVVNCFLKDHSILMLIIMGHGDSEGVICPPGKLESYENGDDLVNLDTERATKLELMEAVRIEDIQNSLFACRELERIPKLLLLNSCRGEYEFTARNYFQMTADSPGRGEIFSHMDIITCYSALPNFVSWRDTQKGSLFVNVFCDILTKRPDIEICELFTLMNARLMKPTADMSRAFAPLHNGYANKTAMPFDFTSSLRKKLYLKLPETLNT